MATVTKSVRLPEEMVRDIERRQGPRSFNAVVRAALRTWLKRRKRMDEDAMIVEDLQGRSPQRIAEEREIAAQSAASARRVLDASGR